MRAFLREPSTPWIVFDQEGRPPSQLAVGELLPGSRRTLLSFSDASFFPATAIVDAAASGRAEPSSLAVASDLEAADEHAPDGDEALALGALPPRVGLSRRMIGASAAALALVSILAVGALLVRGASRESASVGSAATQPASRSFGAAVPADLPPPELDLPAPAAAPESAASAAALAAAALPDSSEPEAVPATATAPKKKVFARLSIAGAARSRAVFFDGKRLLGHGARGFTVACGAHTIAVGDRADAREVEIPCTGNARFVVSK